MQAATFWAAYDAAVAQDDRPMMRHLAAAAKSARVERGLNQSRIAAALGEGGRNQTGVTRFEGMARTKDYDEMIGAYADELGIHPIEIWKRAITAWEADLAAEAEGGQTGPERPETADPRNPHIDGPDDEDSSEEGTG